MVENKLNYSSLGAWILESAYEVYRLVSTGSSSIKIVESINVVM